MRIAIVGGGILGLMSLYQLTRAFGRHIAVDLYARELFTRQTCSFRKGGFVDPFFAKGEDVPRWTRITYELYARLNGHAPGVMRRTLRVFLEEHSGKPACLDALPAAADVRDLDVALPTGFKQGFRLETFVLDQERFLPWLLSESMTGRVEIHLRTINALEELVGVDAVIDAAGLGVRDFGFPEAVPVRGQWLLLEGDLAAAPAGNGVYFAPQAIKKHLAYAVGGDGWTLVGGTYQIGDSDPRIRPEDEETFLQAAAELVPQVDKMPVISRGVQFRPAGGSSQVVRRSLSNGTPVYHLVFPAGSGISLAAGYATHVLEGLARDLNW